MNYFHLSKVVTVKKLRQYAGYNTIRKYINEELARTPQASDEPKLRRRLIYGRVRIACYKKFNEKKRKNFCIFVAVEDRKHPRIKFRLATYDFARDNFEDFAYEALEKVAEENAERIRNDKEIQKFFHDIHRAIYKVYGCKRYSQERWMAMLNEIEYRQNICNSTGWEGTDAPGWTFHSSVARVGFRLRKYWRRHALVSDDEDEFF